ncbi:MAG: response regulator [Myxococcales bacterium]|nr:response regulator [Myxococcales bacterium]
MQLLVVAADEGDRRAVQHSLEGAEMSATLTELADGPTAIQVLAERTFDCVLLDEGVFGGEGLRVLSAVRERGVHVPFIMLTAGAEVAAVDLMKQGAADCVPKTHLESDRLAQAVRQAIRVTRAEQGTRDAEAALAHRAGRFARLALASPRIHASLSVEETIATVAQEARELFGVSFAVTRVTVEGQTLVRVAAAPELVSAQRAQRRELPRVTELAAKIPQPSEVRRIDRSKVVEAPVLGELHQALVDEGFLVDEWLVAPWRRATRRSSAACTWPFRPEGSTTPTSGCWRS